jgi:hypothetical protein
MNTRIKLKNIKFYEALSEETNSYSAVVYFDGKQVGLCSNNGRGGETNVCLAYMSSKDLFKEAREYCKTLPAITYPSFVEGETFSVDSTIENVCDSIFEDWLKEKEDKKFVMRYQKVLVYKKDNEHSYRELSFNIGGKKADIKTICANPKGVEYLKKSCERLISEGHKIMNSNLPFELTY